MGVDQAATGCVILGRCDALAFPHPFRFVGPLGSNKPGGVTAGIRPGSERLQFGCSCRLTAGRRIVFTRRERAGQRASARRHAVGLAPWQTVFGGIGADSTSTLSRSSPRHTEAEILDVS